MLFRSRPWPHRDGVLGTVVSYGIRRCEFDAYLLRRCGAKRLLGIPVTRIEQTGGNWIVNGQLQAPVLVGAGGHFCPVARLLGRKRRGRVVVAREFEVVTHLPTDAPEWGDQAGPPQLYFSDDLLGYGWVFPKGNCVNVGLGRFGERRLTEATERFAEWLRREGRIPPDVANRGRWHGDRKSTRLNSSH